MSAQVDLEPGAQPRFFKCRPDPFALRDQVNKELERQINPRPTGRGYFEPPPPLSFSCDIF